MKVYVETLGCPKNFNDSQVAKGIMSVAGHSITEDLAEADAVMVNTCGFINDAKKESIDRIFELAGSRKDGALLIVSGCLSQRYGQELFAEMPEVDVMLGVNDYERLPEILEQHERFGTGAGDSDRIRRLFASGEECPFVSHVYRELNGGHTATLKIAEGCDNRCAYCIIPSIRGGFRSRPMEEIETEVRKLAAHGCRELILIAQDVTHYGSDIYGEQRLPELLKRLCGIDGIEWIRLMYCYEDRITDELIEVMAAEPKVCHYIDIPIQHASDKILKLMKRRSTKSSIRETIGRLRTAMPDIHIRTTLITGFPGEKAAEFEELCDFVEEMRFERLGVFPYSKEEGTEAAEMKPQVREDVKRRRAETIMRMQLDISLEKNQEKVGKVLEVIVDEKDEDGAYIGRTRYDAPEIDNAVIFKADRNIEIGEITRVKITDAFDYDLIGVEVQL